MKRTTPFANHRQRLVRHRWRAEVNRRRSTGRRFGYVLLGVGIVVLAVFLPGPNGVLKVWAKHRQIVRLTRDIRSLTVEIDSLESCCRVLAHPDSARELARRTFGSIGLESASGPP
ncbi:MAG: hypothetical protein ABIL25_07515 [candidate division WOR-3 bacterium]